MTESMLTPAEIPAYIKSRTALEGLVDTDALAVSEVGDGNLNLIFICEDASGRRLVLKQALPYVRLVGPDWPMTEARAAREAAAIRVHSRLSPHVCQLIDFDPGRNVLVLEDLSDHDVFRSRLNDGGPYEGVAERLGEYVADVAFGSSFLTLTEEEFRQRAAEAINPELCAITEALVFTEPYLGAERNGVRPSLAPLVAELQADEAWIASAMVMKRLFLCSQETLLHGDLHSGSAFVRGDGETLSVKTFDSEFACYGPVGFDLGMMWANMFFAGARAGALGDLARAEDLFKTAASSWQAFTDRLRERWPSRRSPADYPDAFLDAWLQAILVESFGFAGCEAARRTIGLAKVSDLETLDDAAYASAGTLMLRLSRLLLVDLETITFDRIVHTALTHFRERA